MRLEKRLEILKKSLLLRSIDKVGSLKKASLIEKVSSSALSQSISSLELELGQAVLQRNSKGVELTVLGKNLIRQTEAVLNSLEGLDVFDFSKNKLEITSMDFGTYESLAIEIMPTLLATLTKDYPNIRIKSHVTRSENLISLLKNGTLCTLLIPSGYNLDGLKTIKVAEEYLGLYFPENKALNLNDILSKGYGGLSPSKNGHPTYYSKFIKSLDGLKLPKITSDSFESLKSLAENEILPCILPHRVARRSQRKLINLAPKINPKSNEISKHDLLLVMTSDCSNLELNYLAENIKHIL